LDQQKNQPGLKIKLYDAPGKRVFFTVKEFIDKIKSDIQVANKCLDVYESNYRQAEEDVREDEDRVNVAAVVKAAKEQGMERVSALPKDPELEKYANDIIIKFHLELYGVEWKVYKSLSNFKELEKAITYFKVYKEYPLPKPSDELEVNKLKEEDLKNPQIQRSLKAYAELLIEYTMKVMINTSFSSKFKEVLNFWGISSPFIRIRCQKLAEFEAYKFSQGRKNNACLEKLVKSMFGRWQKRWVFVGYNSIWYYESAEDEHWKIRDCIPMDLSTRFQVSEINEKKGVTFELFMSRRKLKLNVGNMIDGLYAVWSIVKAFMCSTYTVKHRFHSFAPLRMKNDVDFYVDGEGYFAELYNQIKHAKVDIMICGWFISPEVPLKRPIKNYLDHDETRLDFVLKEAADKGVKVYVLVYKQVNVSMYNDSEHAKHRLEKLSKNIKVIRHPVDVLMGPLWWSHHEKMVIVDRKVVMMGGLDICWGRWDTCEHKLFDYTDLGSFHPNIDYYNPFKKELIKGGLYQNDLISRKEPRMPWHDVAVKLTGEVVFDFMTHFMTYWNNAREQIGDQSIEVLFPLMPLLEATTMVDDRLVRGLNKMIGKMKGRSEPSSPRFGVHEENHEEHAQPFSKESSFSSVRELERKRSIAIFTVKNYDNSSDSDIDQGSPNPNSPPQIQFNNLNHAFSPEMSPGRNLRITDINLLKVEKIGRQGKEEYEEYPFPFGWQLMEKLDEIYDNPDVYYEPLPSNHIPIEFPDDAHIQQILSTRECHLMDYVKKVTSGGEMNGAHALTKPSSSDMPGENEEVEGGRDEVEGEFSKISNQYYRGSLNGSAHGSKRSISKATAKGYTPFSMQKLGKNSSLKNQMTSDNALRPVPRPRKRTKLQRVENLDLEEQDGIERPSFKKKTMSCYANYDHNISYKYVMDEDEDDLSIEIGAPIEPNDPRQEPNSCRSPTRRKIETISYPRKRARQAKRKSVYEVDYEMEMQALRSASPWSIGLYEVEHSIHNAYIATIIAAKRFIYIENQFFISNTGNKEEADLKNRVVKALYSRIKTAIRNKEDFKVIIFIPLLPAFEADLEQKNGPVMQLQIALQNMTIGVDDKMSFIAKVHELTQRHGEHAENYVMVCALRKWDYVPDFIEGDGVNLTGPTKKAWCSSSKKRSKSEQPARSHKKVDPDHEKPMTGLIYIHSKLLIADDSDLIIGSANLNDRSLYGKRDSELAVYMKGDLDLPIRYGASTFKVNRKIHNFRCQIFEEHFGMQRNEVLFPNSSKFWAKAWNIAHINQQVYEKVFSCYPSNKFTTWESLKDANVFDKEAFFELKDLIRGHAVTYPYKFLSAEDLIKVKEKGMLKFLPFRALL